VSTEERILYRQLVGRETRRLIRAARLEQLFPTILAQPLEWQVATLGICAAACDERRVMDACEQWLVMLKPEVQPAPPPAH
jgi:hypothetical protein